jgi:mRNA-degrading endonuclease toxin of MazEF toxin-antitoxin module
LDRGGAGHQNRSRHPTEIELDEDHGLGVTSAASFDNIQPIRRTFLTEKVGSLPLARPSICRALGALADC